MQSTQTTISQTTFAALGRITTSALVALFLMNLAIPFAAAQASDVRSIRPVVMMLLDTSATMDICA